MTLKILLNGAQGRMGTAIAKTASKQNAEIVGSIDRDDQIENVLSECDVVIDFSFHSATAPLAEKCVASQKPLVIGTTGHQPDEKERILKATSEVPIVWAGNYSIGVNLLFHYTEQVASKLGNDYHPEIIEMHHRHKKDAPSGTATDLLSGIIKARKMNQDQICYGRKGITGERPDQEVGIHAVRGGDIIGEHTVLFAGPGERFELTHRATDRSIFAHGAIRAAHWVISKQSGLYNMRDVLGLT